MCVCVGSIVSDSLLPWTVAHQAPLSMEYSRQEYWRGLSFPTPADHPDPGINLHLLHLLHWPADSLPVCHLGRLYWLYSLLYNTVRVKVKVTQKCLTLCDPMDYIIHGIFQTRILEWVAVPLSSRSSQPSDRTQISHIAGWFFTI